MSSTVERFKSEFQKHETEIGLGPVEHLKATVEDVIPRHDNGKYTQSEVWVKFPSKWLYMFQGPDKWGEVFIFTGIYDQEPEGGYVDTESATECQLVEDLMGEELGMTIEELADSIFYSQPRLVVERNIDLTNVQDADIQYLEECLRDLKEARGE